MQRLAKWLVLLVILVVGCSSGSSDDGFGAFGTDTDGTSDDDGFENLDVGAPPPGCYGDPTEDPTAALGEGLAFLIDREVQRDLLDCLGQDTISFRSEVSITGTTEAESTSTVYTVQIRRTDQLVEQIGNYVVDDDVIAFVFNDDTVTVTNPDGQTFEAPSDGATTAFAVEQLDPMGGLQLLRVPSAGLPVTGVLLGLSAELIGDPDGWEISEHAGGVTMAVNDRPLRLIDNSLIEVAELTFTPTGVPLEATMRYTAPDTSINWKLTSS